MYKSTILNYSSENLILPLAIFLKEDWPIQDLTAADSSTYPRRPEYLCQCNVYP